MILYAALFIWVCVIPAVIAVVLSHPPRRLMSQFDELWPREGDYVSLGGEFDGLDPSRLTASVAQPGDVTFPAD